MLRNVFGPLVAAILGFLCVFGANGDKIGVLQLVSLVVMCWVVGTAIALIGLRHFNIVMFYCVTFVVGSLVAVFVNRVWFM